MIARRHVIHVAGYDPVEPARHHRRFRRELATFAGVWNVTAQAGDLAAAPAGSAWTATTTAPNWQVETTYETFDWQDIVRADLGLPAWRRWPAAALAFVDFILSGTAARYVTASPRYGLFFLAPLIEAVLIVVLSIDAGLRVAAALPLGALVDALIALAVAVALFALLIRWPGRALRLDQALDNWIFAQAYLRGRRADIDTRIDAFAARLIAIAAAGGADEVVIVGHSFGALIAIDLLNRALARAPDLAAPGSRLRVLTVGAIIPKLTLHPAGGYFRACARRLADATAIDWVEVQARDDAISFYKFHPVSLRRIDDRNPAPAPRPFIRRVQIHEMLTAESFRRYRWRFMRMHYQFVMANERRAAYDYFMTVCGPLVLSDIARAANGPRDLFGDDGALLEAPATAGRNQA